MAPRALETGAPAARMVSMSALGWLHTACAVAALASGAVMAVGAILVARRARTALDPFRRASGGGATRLAD